jgi:hypothetical protein
MNHDHNSYNAATPSPGYTVMGETFNILLNEFRVAIEEKIRYLNLLRSLEDALHRAKARFEAFEEDRLFSAHTVNKILEEEVSR